MAEVKAEGNAMAGYRSQRSIESGSNMNHRLKGHQKQNRSSARKAKNDKLEKGNKASRMDNRMEDKVKHKVGYRMGAARPNAQHHGRQNGREKQHGRLNGTTSDQIGNMMIPLFGIYTPNPKPCGEGAMITQTLKP